jgi:TrmH family RNA methyltransferase
MKKIDSRTNPLYRAWKSLLEAKGIKEQGSLLVAGRKLVPEFLKRSDLRIQYILISDPKDVELLAFNKSLEVIWLKKDLFDEIDDAGTHFPILVLEAPPLTHAGLDEKPQGLEVILSLSNPLNLGAALRSCEAFEVDRVYLTRECAHPFLTKVLRSSSGSSLRVPLALAPSLTALTEAQTKMIHALEMEGDSLATTDLPQNLRLLIGEEGRGIPEGLPFAGHLAIPMKEGMDSLNAVAATAIALFAYRQKNG